MGVGYDSADKTIEREHSVQAAGGAAATEFGKFRSFSDAKLLQARAVVTTAGTSASPGHKLDIYVGTASVGSFGLGSSTAGVAFSTALNVDVPALSPVFVKTGTDATGAADVTFEYRRT